MSPHRSAGAFNDGDRGQGAHLHRFKRHVVKLVDVDVIVDATSSIRGRITRNLIGSEMSPRCPVGCDSLKGAGTDAATVSSV